MHDLLLRTADASDYPAICRLVSGPGELFRVFPGARWPLTPKQLHRVAEQRSELTVACIGTTIAGFANLYEIRPLQSAFIGNLVIASRYRQQGAGNKLLQHMLEKIFSCHDLREARISVFGDNQAALGLYRNTGFRTYASELRRDPQQYPVTLLHMHLYRDSGKSQIPAENRKKL